MLSEGEIVAMATELLDVRRSRECHGVLGRWLPRVVRFDRLEYTLCDLKTGACLRRTTPGLPPEVLTDCAADEAWGGMMLVLARSSPPGSCFRMSDLANHPKKPAGWDEMLTHLGNACGLMDFVCMVLYSSEPRQRGLVLTLWRERPSPAFTAQEAAGVRILGPMLARAFTRSFDLEYRDLQRLVSKKMLAGAGQFAFLVTRDGKPLFLDDEVLLDLSPGFGFSRRGDGVPQAFRALVCELITALQKNPIQGVSTADYAKKDRRCRVHLSRVDPSPDGAPIFKVLVDSNPDCFSLSSLSEAGLTDFQVSVLELLQRGGHSAKIAEAFGVSLGDVNYHLKEIGEKVYADGKTEIVARALTLLREIAIRRGFAGSQDEQKDAFGPRRVVPEVPWWSVPPPAAVSARGAASRPRKGPLRPAPALPARRPEVSV
jgi:DNA-binding CsgD family transcriptional regulator